MHSYHKEATVGALVLLGLAVFLGGSLWLRGSSWNKSDLVPVYYEDIGNLKQGAPVRISGAPVGRVEDIHYVALGRVLVMLDIDREKVVPTTAASAEIVSVGMLGDAMIDFRPGEGTPITGSDTLKGSLGGGDLMSVGTQLAAKAGTTLDALNRMFDTTLTVELRGTLRSTNQLMTYLADQKNGPTAELNNTLITFQRTGNRLDSTLAALDVKGLQDRLGGTMQTADSTMRALTALSNQLAGAGARFDQILADIQAGKGTLGKLASDTAFYSDLQKLLQTVTRLVDELAKNPGKLGITVKIP